MTNGDIALQNSNWSPNLDASSQNRGAWSRDSGGGSGIRGIMLNIPPDGGSEYRTAPVVRLHKLVTADN